MQKSQSYLIIIFTLVSFYLPKQGKGLSGDTWAHDPSSIIKEGNKYWVFTTGDGINAKSSTDLYNWKAGDKTVFAKGTWPSWINGYVPGFAGVFWAPDIIFMNGRFYLYYACSTMGSQISAIGVATSPALDQNSPGYQWTDMGMVVSSSSVEDINAIDPSIFKDTDGKLYLSYGSYSDGIGVIELDTATGKVKPGAQLHRVAGGGHAPWEASCLIKEGNYYYLFVNRAYCCLSTSSTYYMAVGRSASPTGPFADKSGIDLRSNNSLAGGTPVLVSSGRYIGPGHFGLLRDNGRNIVSMHYYDGLDNGNSKLDIAILQFTDDGWPVLNRNYLTAGRYKISNSQSKLVWQGTGCSGSDAEKMILNTDNDAPCQNWDLTPVGDGYYKISNQGSAGALSVPSCNSTNGVNLVAWTWLNNDCQKFKIEQLANGQYTITSLANHTASKVIQASAPANSAGTPLSISDYNGLATQQWTISELSTPKVLEPINISDSGFTAKWKSVPGATYRLDVFTSLTNAAVQTIASWDFESGNNKANAGIPDNPGKPVTATGTNAAIYNAKGNDGQTAQATGWQFSKQEKYWEINFTTEHYYNIKVSSKQRSAASGPRHFKLQYKIGDAGTYTDIPTGLVSNLDNYTAGILDNISLPEECENQPSIYLRWVLITPTNLIDASIEPSAESNIDDILIAGNQSNFLPGYNNLLIEDTAKLINGLPSGTDFFFRVRAVQGSFTSKNSDVIKVTTTGMLPLTFKTIEAGEKNRDIQVDWQVAAENNVAAYDVEKSANGQLFTQIGKITATSVSTPLHSYSYLDVKPQLSNNFYRIKATLSSGVIKYSPAVKVYRERGQGGIYFYPNPSDGKTITIHLFNQATGVNNIQLLNNMGQEMYSTRINHAGGSLRLSLLLGNLPTGVYHFRITNGNIRTGQTIIVTSR